MAEALRLKHHAFSFEQEVRLIAHLNDERKKKKCPATFKKYIDLHFKPKINITGVRISPYGNKAENKQFLEEYKNKNLNFLHDDFKIFESDIPVR